MNWHEYVKMTGELPKWPYEVNYGRENVYESDVLVLGGGVAGCRAAIAAAKQGASVVVADRGFAKRSGMGGVGVDHWHGAVTNPCSRVTPEEYSDIAMECAGGYTNGLARYIVGREGWDTLLELEQMGVQIRDEDDEFKGSMFRDDETKLLFAYDVDNRHCLRIWGNNIKECVNREMRRLNAEVVERVCITSLLTEGGKQGTRVIGATGINDRTGEFYIFKAKAVVIATGRCGGRLFGFAPEVTEAQSMSDLNQVAMGNSIGWKAGAEFIMCDQVGNFAITGFGYAPYSTGNSDNTYQGSPMVDAEGKRVAHANAFGELLTDERQIFEAAHPKDHFVIGHGIGLAMTTPESREYTITSMDPDIGAKVRSGELKLPLYTDLTLLDKKDRELIFNMMLSQEGKCRVPIFRNWTNAGFDPARDMIQMPIRDPDSYSMIASWCGIPESSPPNWRQGGGGYYVDWRMQTSLPGLFTGGEGPNFGHGCHGESHTTGRYSGRQAAHFAAGHESVEPERAQIEAEKERVYAPTRRKNGDVGWKELNYAIARVMQDYCGDYKTDEILELGIRRLYDLRDTEGERTYVSNPHELARMMEDFSLIDLGSLTLAAQLQRKASLPDIGYKRTDHPEDDPTLHCFLPVRQKDGGFVSRKLDCRYYRMAPYSDCLAENYELFNIPPKQGGAK